jgi:hypothetical protein
VTPHFAFRCGVLFLVVVRFGVVMRSIGWTTSILVAQALLWLGVSEFGPAMAQGRSGKATASRTLTGSWIHNGSVMSLVTDGKTQKFIYYTPRIGLLDAGVKPGTLLFEGRRTGRTFVGTAYQFYRTCKPRGFRVSGTVSEDQKQIILKGKVPLLDVNCKVTGTRDDVLVFTANPAPPAELAAESKAGAAPVANTAEQVASRTPAKEPASDRAVASKPEETRAPEAPLAEADKAKAGETPSQASSAAAAKAPADAENDKPSAPKAEPPDAAIAPDKPTQDAPSGGTPETNVAAAVPAKDSPSTAPAVAAETPTPDAEKASASPKQGGDAAQAESGQAKPPAAAAAAKDKDSVETEAAGKAKAEGSTVAGQAPKANEAAAGTAPTRQPQQTPQTETTESKVAAIPTAAGDPSQADDPAKAKAAAREVAAAPNEAAKQDGANSRGVPSEQGGAEPPQAESRRAKVAAASPAVAASTNGDDASKAKAADGKAAGSLQTALKPPPSNAEGDRTGALGENRSAGLSESRAAAPAAAEKMMEIVLRNGRILRIGRDVDLEVLARIVTMLER